jgi:hypothetical protein
MAMAAWMRARQLAPTVAPERLVGLACTASLATNRPKQGPHRIHVAAQTANCTRSVSLTLDKNVRSRLQEEGLASGLLLGVLAEVCDVDSGSNFQPVQELLKGNERLEFLRQTAKPAWTQLLLGERKWVWTGADASESEQVDLEGESLRTTSTMLFPGAFNPPHAGHLQMARFAAQRFARPVQWELSIRNVDKPALDFVEIARRLAGLRDMFEPPRQQEARGPSGGIPSDEWRPDSGWGACGGVVLTAAPTFLDKARLFPGCLFVVGADTVIRIGELRYYHQDQRQRDRAIDELAALGCRFLVFGRLLSDAPKDLGAGISLAPFRTLRQLPLPQRLRALCDEVSAEEFRVDLRSRDLRC